jgi:UDP-N-acetylmuramoyl-tripeptide--D-alanyl-D-alanine ligase
MAASIRAAAEMANVMRRDLVLVLGEMHELGIEAARGHEEVGRVAAESRARLVIAFGGGEARRMASSARDGGADVLFFPSAQEAVGAVVHAVRATDLVLIKGSRASGAETIVQELARQPSGSG